MILRNKFPKLLRVYTEIYQFAPRFFTLLLHRPETYWQAAHHTTEKIPTDVQKDMIQALRQWGCAYDEYFFFDFESNREKGYRNQFITDADSRKYFRRLNRFQNQHLFDNKLDTYSLYGKYYGRTVISLLKSDEGKDSFISFAQRNSEFVAKKNFSGGGHGVIKVNSKDFSSLPAMYTWLLSNGYDLVEELIVQSKEMASLHPESVNTVRIPTILTGKDVSSVKLFHPFLRIGVGRSFVDNGGSGGILVKLDPSTGITCTDGCDETNNRYTTQPDSKITLKGFQLPDWEQAVSLVKEAALILPTNRYVSWDLAHTKNGWILVEANARGQFVGQQMCDCVGKKEELDEIISQMKV